MSKRKRFDWSLIERAADEHADLMRRHGARPARRESAAEAYRRGMIEGFVVGSTWLLRRLAAVDVIDPTSGEPAGFVLDDATENVAITRAACYERKPERVNATRWLRPGDHPGVRLNHGIWCLSTGSQMIWIEPGDWILAHADGGLSAMSDESFREVYAPTREECDA